MNEKIQEMETLIEDYKALEKSLSENKNRISKSFRKSFIIWVIVWAVSVFFILWFIPSWYLLGYWFFPWMVYKTQKTSRDFNNSLIESLSVTRQLKDRMILCLENHQSTLGK